MVLAVALEQYSSAAVDGGSSSPCHRAVRRFNPRWDDMFLLESGIDQLKSRWCAMQTPGHGTYLSLGSTAGPHFYIGASGDVFLRRPFYAGDHASSSVHPLCRSK